MTFNIIGIFAAGLLTFLSPCILPLVPVFTASILKADRKSRFLSTLAFVGGFTIVFIMTGLSIPFLMNGLGGGKTWILFALSFVFILFGLRMTGIFQKGKVADILSRSFVFQAPFRKMPPLLRSGLFGVFFGLSWTPCVGPILGGVLTYTLSQEMTVIHAVVMLFSYAMGISIPLLLAAVSVDYFQGFLTRLRPWAPRVEAFVGVILVGFGISVLYQSSGYLMTRPSLVENEVKLAEDMPQRSQIKMLFFFSKDCSVCHAMQKFLSHFEQSCQSELFRVVHADINEPSFYSTVDQFGVRAVPTMVFVDSHGKEISRLVGFQTESHLKEIVQSNPGLVCQSRPFPQPPDVDLTPLIEPNQTCSSTKAC
jgi:cytochrome c-type biogenesis protein